LKEDTKKMSPPSSKSIQAEVICPQNRKLILFFNIAVPEFTAVEIANTNPEDLSKVFELYNHAIAYQHKHGYNVWPHFREQMVQEEIRMNRHWKITEGTAMACVFSVAYNDPPLGRKR
jgi:hypothetical protein